MDSMLAYIMGQMNKNKEPRVFDWNKAAQIIMNRKPESAIAGLQGDLEWTGGRIWENGKPIMNDYTFLSSTWAMPILVIDDEEIPCYLMEHETTWNEDTKWPESALNIIRMEEKDNV